MANPDPYVILGISPDATPEQIRAAFRTAVRHAHPDTSATSADASPVRRVIDAYRLLADPVERARYDAAHSSGNRVDPHIDHTPHGRDPAARRWSSRGAPPCPGCGGTGVVLLAGTCPTCRGRAEITELDATRARILRCPACRGFGRIGLQQTCEGCSGTGEVVTGYN